MPIPPSHKRCSFTPPGRPGPHAARPGGLESAESGLTPCDAEEASGNDLWHQGNDASASALKQVYQNLFWVGEANNNFEQGIQRLQRILISYVVSGTPTSVYPDPSNPDKLLPTYYDNFINVGTNTFSWEDVVEMTNDFLRAYNYAIDSNGAPIIPQGGGLASSPNLSTEQVSLVRRLLICQSLNTRISPFEAPQVW